ncbi:MAG: hypothetical protein LC126_08885, partial [Bryobacterales bacterium]|nr:hypothetical protein [Bryobacterales bacterium]
IVNGALAPILAVYIPAPGETSRAQVNIQVPMERNATLNTDGSEDFLTPTVLQSGVAIVAVAFYREFIKTRSGRAAGCFGSVE